VLLASEDYESLTTSCSILPPPLFRYNSTMLKNLLDACGAAIAFYMVGYAFAFGGQDSVVGNTFVGTTNFFLTGEPVNMGFWFFEWAFSATTVTIVAGTLAERCQMIAYLAYSIFLTGFVYPVIVHAVWSNNGFISAFSASPLLGCGAIDFAGSGVVHVTGGTTSLIATYILGARRGRFHDERGRPLDEPNPMPGHSIALQLLGTMILWFGCTFIVVDIVVVGNLSLYELLITTLNLTCASPLRIQGTASIQDRP
jgi:ammonium transporter, Amt family